MRMICPPIYLKFLNVAVCQILGDGKKLFPTVNQDEAVAFRRRQERRAGSV